MLVDVDLVYLSFADVALWSSMTRLIPEVIIILPWGVVGEMIVPARCSGAFRTHVLCEEALRWFS